MLNIMKTCRKIPYKSRKHAANVINRTDKYRSVFGKPYLCPKCGEWHLGRKLDKKSKLVLGWRKHIRSMKKLSDLIDVYCGNN